MFAKIKTKIECWMCGDSNKRFKTCSGCKKLVCTDCKTCVFVSGGNYCHKCLMKNYE